MVRVGINGFGRIGRVVFRNCLKNPDVKIAAINDPAIDVEYICYLIKFDSTHGKYNGKVTHTKNEITVDETIIKVFQEKLPTSVPWQTAGVEYVVEASGMFTSLEKASGHLASDGVKKVIVTAPSVDVPMVILGVNHNKINSDQKVVSCASSTLYCLAPIIKILEDNYGVSDGFITSIHAMTPSLKPLDGLCLRGKHHWRDHRSIHQNIIPATTGACKALGKIIPQVKDKLTGLAFRVPVVNVSVLDLTIRLNKNTTIKDMITAIDDINSETLKKIVTYCNEEAVSSDFSGDSHSCILDVRSSMQLRPNYFKLVCWYENEYSYACRVVDTVLFFEKQQQLADCNPNVSLQTVCSDSLHNNELSEHKFTHDKAKIMHTQSQTTEIKQKLIRQLDLKKPTSHQKPIIALTRKEDICRMCNKEIRTIKRFKHQNNDSAILSSTDITSDNTRQIENFKVQKRLHDVKKEFTKMVNITEDLLKKANYNKYQENFPNKLKNDCVIDNTKSIFSSDSNRVNGEYINSDPLTVSTSKDTSCNTFKNNTSDFAIFEVKQKDDVLKIVQDSIPLQRENSKEQFTAVKQVTKGTSDTFNDHKEKTIKAYRDDDKLYENIRFENSNDRLYHHIELDKSNRNSVNKLENVKRDYNNSFTDDSGFTTPKEKNVERDVSSSNNLFLNAPISEKENKSHIQCYLVDRKLEVTERTVSPKQIYTSKILGNDIRNDVKTEKSCHKEIGVPKKILQRLNNYLPESIAIVSDHTSADRCQSPENTVTTVNDDYRHQDIYDKLDSASATDSDNSFEFNERKSQVINISDLTTSLEDLARLDKICRIMEISDELSDKLFSTLDEDKNTKIRNKKWSFKDLCEKIKLDEFCNKIFGK